MSNPKAEDITARIRSQLQKCGKRSFTLREVANIYRFSWGTPLPYRDFGAGSLQEFLERYCDFLTVMKTDDGNKIEVLLNHCSYEESSRGQENNFSNWRTSKEVDKSFSPTFLRQLRMLIDRIGQDGVTIDEFEKAFYQEKSAQINRHELTKEQFYCGLNEVFRTRNDGGSLLLYPAKSVKPKTAKPPASQQRETDAKELTGRVSQRVPPSAQHALRVAIRESVKLTEGWVTFKKFRSFFNETNQPEQLDTYGFSVDEFLCGLPHIFRVEGYGKTVRIFPAAGVPTGLARQSASTKSVSGSAWGSVTQGNPMSRTANSIHTEWRRPTKVSIAKEGGSFDKGTPQRDDANGKYKPHWRPNCSEAGNTSGNAKQKVLAEMRLLTGGAQLWVIKCDGVDYVPTYCLSKLAGLQTDSVVERLRQAHLQPTCSKILADDTTKMSLIVNGLADTGDVIMLSLQSCPTIIRAIMGRESNETLINEISRYIKK